MLKPILFIVCFLGVSFIGMQVVVKMRANEAASKRAAAKKARQAEEKEAEEKEAVEKEAVEKEAVEKEAVEKRAKTAMADVIAPSLQGVVHAAESKSAAPSAPAPQSPPKHSGPAPNQMPVIINASRGDEPEITSPPPRSFTKQTTTKEMYYTTYDVNKHGVPGRIIIHNTPVGHYTVLLIRSSGTLGMGGKGTATGDAKKKYDWEVRVDSGSITVVWDGRHVPPAASAKSSTAR